jgi:hypothetical protein
MHLNPPQSTSIHPNPPQSTPIHPNPPQSTSFHPNGGPWDLSCCCLFQPRPGWNLRGSHRTCQRTQGPGPKLSPKSHFCIKRAREGSENARIPKPRTLGAEVSGVVVPPFKRIFPETHKHGIAYKKQASCLNRSLQHSTDQHPSRFCAIFI